MRALERGIDAQRARLRGVIRAGLYSSLLRALVPAYGLKLWWRGRHEPGYRLALGERLGIYAGQGPERVQPGWLWVHAVSLGETRAAAALLDALREQAPELRVLLTHSTATGRAAGLSLLRAGDRQAWLPLDTPGAVRRFFAHFQPRLGVLMETEIWPNLQHQAQVLGVKMVLANARLSAKSLRQGQRFEALLRPAAESLSLVLAQTEADAQRLVQAGAPRIEVCGNLKFDMRVDPALLAQGQAWRAASSRAIVLAASTREGEETSLLQAWVEQHRAVADGANAARLLIVPRHPQRFDEVARAVEQAGLSLARRSAWAPGLDAEALQADVWLGDSMGEMPAYYAAAEVALLGGSFAPLGGQNLIEAAACACPLVMGPSTFNFEQAAELALACGAAARVGDMRQGVQQAWALLSRHDARRQMAQAARDFSAEHRGAARRMAQAILQLA